MLHREEKQGLRRSANAAVSGKTDDNAAATLACNTAEGNRYNPSIYNIQDRDMTLRTSVYRGRWQCPQSTTSKLWSRPVVTAERFSNSPGVGACIVGSSSVSIARSVSCLLEYQLLILFESVVVDSTKDAYCALMLSWRIFIIRLVAGLWAALVCIRCLSRRSRAG